MNKETNKTNEKTCISLKTLFKSAHKFLENGGTIEHTQEDGNDFYDLCMKNIMIINAIKLFIPFTRKKYISDLCGYYGCPNDVLWVLQQICDKYPILSNFLKTEIAQLQKVVEYYYEPSCDEPEACGCRTCEWGNGEGGCTIPACCLIKN